MSKLSKRIKCSIEIQLPHKANCAFKLCSNDVTNNNQSEKCEIGIASGQKSSQKIHRFYVDITLHLSIYIRFQSPVLKALIHKLFEES